MIETLHIPGTDLMPSRIGLGTRSLLDAADERDPRRAVSMVQAAVRCGMSLIDTAPDHGRGLAEEIVGKALYGAGLRDQVVLATKGGLVWQGGQTCRDARPARILADAEQSLRRLGCEAIDLYLLHWPDPLVPIEETAQAMRQLRQSGKVRALGVCNAGPDELRRFRREAPLHVVQAPYNMLERGVDAEVLPYVRAHGLLAVTYGPLCRGLLSGRMTWHTSFADDDLRGCDPKYGQPLFSQYLEAVRRLDELARERFGRRAVHLALRWVLDRPGVGAVLWGVRQTHQIDPLRKLDFVIDDDAAAEIDRILAETVPQPTEPEFMAPPPRARVAA